MILRGCFALLAMALLVGDSLPAQVTTPQRNLYIKTSEQSVHLAYCLSLCGKCLAVCPLFWLIRCVSY